MKEAREDWKSRLFVITPKTSCKVTHGQTLGSRSKKERGARRLTEHVTCDPQWLKNINKTSGSPSNPIKPIPCQKPQNTSESKSPCSSRAFIHSLISTYISKESDERFCLPMRKIFRSYFPRFVEMSLFRSVSTRRSFPMKFEGGRGKKKKSNWKTAD